MHEIMSDSKSIVLFATPVLHHPSLGGPELRIENSIKALSRISQLHLYSRIPLAQMGGTPAYDFFRSLCASVSFAPILQPTPSFLRIAQKAVNFSARMTVKRTLFHYRSKSSEDFHFLLQYAARIRADLIWLGYGNISYPLLKYIKLHSNLPVVLDTDSVYSRYVLRGLAFAQDAEERERIQQRGTEKENEEACGTKLADVTTAVSEVDAQYYRQLAKDPSQIHLFANVIDPDRYVQTTAPPALFKKPCLYLAGTFWRHSPMEDAARWVIRDVLPLVRREQRDIHLYILGNGSEQTLADIADPAVTVLGSVPSVLPYLPHADVVLVPLRFESGTRFKILEAGACNLPVVSTTLGAEGLDVEDGTHLLIADDPEAFSNAILRLLHDRKLAIKLGRNLGQLVENSYTIDALAKQGQAILEYLSRNKPDMTKAGAQTDIQ